MVTSTFCTSRYRGYLARGKCKRRCRDGAKQEKLNSKLAMLQRINVADESQLR